MEVRTFFSALKTEDIWITSKTSPGKAATISVLSIAQGTILDLPTTLLHTPPLTLASPRSVYVVLSDQGLIQIMSESKKVSRPF